MPGRVVINEYVDIANAFFTADEPGLVNGLLDRVARDVRPGGILQGRGRLSAPVLPDELSIIDRFFRPLAGEGAFDLRDDAAVHRAAAGPRTRRHHRHGRARRAFPATTRRTRSRKKALRVNLSDLAAKGATPLGYVLSIGLPPDIDESWLAGFAEGLRDDQATLLDQASRRRHDRRAGSDRSSPSPPSAWCRRAGWCAASAGGRATGSMSPGRSATALWGSRSSREEGPWVGLQRERARRADPALSRAGAAVGAGAGARRIRFGRDGCLRRAGRRLRQALRGVGLLGGDRRGQGAACAGPRRIRTAGPRRPPSDARRGLRDSLPRSRRKKARHSRRAAGAAGVPVTRDRQARRRHTNRRRCCSKARPLGLSRRAFVHGAGEKR